jgi:hypothetical protein
MLHSYRRVRVVSWRPDLQVYARRWSQKPVPRASPPSPVKQRQAHWISLMQKLPMIFQPQPSACYFMHDMILRQIIMATQPLAAINLYTPWHICYRWFEKRREFFLKNVFQNGYDEGLSPLSPFERDDQGLPGLGEGLRWWLSRVRCEQKDCPII